MNNLEKESLWKIFWLSLLTIGIYMPLWIDKRMKKLNSMSSKEKISKSTINIVVILFIIYIILIIPEIIYEGTPEGITIKNLSSFISFAGNIGFLILAFKVRRILADEYKDMKFSKFATFFFSIFYLQLKINNLSENRYAHIKKIKQE